MRREVTRQKTLSAFRLDVAALELLWQKMEPLFGGENTMRSNMTVELLGETIDLKHPSELRSQTDLPAVLTRFSLRFSEGERSVSINSQTSFADRPSVRAWADNEAWCAGAVETVANFLRPRRPWYFWISGAPFGWMILAANIPNTALWAAPALKQKLPSFVAQAILIFFLLCLLLFFARAKVFPASVLRLSQNENIVRRYAPEITVGMTALGLVLTIVGWFVSK